MRTTKSIFGEICWPEQRVLFMNMNHLRIKLYALLDWLGLVSIYTVYDQILWLRMWSLEFLGLSKISLSHTFSLDSGRQYPYPLSASVHICQSLQLESAIERGLTVFTTIISCLIQVSLIISPCSSWQKDTMQHHTLPSHAFPVTFKAELSQKELSWV